MWFEGGPWTAVLAGSESANRGLCTDGRCDSTWICRMFEGCRHLYRVFAFAATSPLLDGGLVLFWMTKIIAIASSDGVIQMQIG